MMKQVYNNQHLTGLEIAIIGIGCHFPGAANWREYWQNLINGVESIRFLSDQELAKCGLDEKTFNNKNFIRVKSTIKDKDVFDSSFFGYTSDEAQLMNPMHRIFHHCVWEALEDAGYDPERTKGLIGLYAGGGDDLNWRVYSSLKNSHKVVDDFTLHQLNNKDYLASLLSYKLNLKGPAFVVNTACSTSLVAINLACKSILLGETKMALAGGISCNTRKLNGYFYQEGMINSSDGYCRAFDKNASGTVFGEGAGVVVLKRLNEAIQDGDQIYAVIKGGAINNDGNSKVGFSAPSVGGQADCIKKALKFARVDPVTIGFIEAHGTGTKLGDPIEVEALNLAYNNKLDKTCALGSVKTMIGHLDAAAGVAGLIKTTLSLKNKQIPASLHFSEPNPEIHFNKGPFYVNNTFKKWDSHDGMPLRAAVSSFGVGGTNAHVILEEAPEVEESGIGREYLSLNISAKTEISLTQYANKLKKFLIEEEAINLADMAYTFKVGRKHFPYRKSIVYQNKEDLINLLDSAQIINSIASKSIIFMFSGVGSQYVNMGKDLYENERIFRDQIDKGFVILHQATGVDYKNILYPQSNTDLRINEIQHIQPLVFLFGYSLARLMMEWGITPAYMIGHSLGEYVAACISGVFSFQDALRLVIKRGQLMNTMSPGSMLSVSISEVSARMYVNEKISLAAINGSDQVVFSGDTSSMEELRKRFDDLDVSCVRLHTSCALHSQMVDSILTDFAKELETTKINSPQIPFISNLTGKVILPEEATSVKYWVRHMRESVNFLGGIETLIDLNKNSLFVEIGAGHALTNLVRQYRVEKNKPISLNLIKHAKDQDNDEAYLTNRLGQLWAHGIEINWVSYYADEKRRRISLPTYSFDPIRYPAEVDPLEHGLSFGSVGKTNNKELKDCFYYSLWKQSLSHFSFHQISGKGYVLFSFNDEFSAVLQAELLQQDNQLVVVLPGKLFEKKSKYLYVVNPIQSDDFDRLFTELQRDEITITDIIYSWGIAIDESKIELEEHNTEIYLAYFSVVKIIQTLLYNNALHGKRFAILTDSLHKVTGQETGSYGQSLLLGLVNVLPQEYSVTCFNIDLDLSEHPVKFVKKLTNEINGNTGKNDRIVALRRGYRWIKDYQKNDQPIEPVKSPLKDGGVYLITGGLGDVGFSLAKYLIKKYAARIILIGRKPIEDLLISDVGKNGLNRLTYLKAISNDVRYFSADVSCFEDLNRVVAEAENSLGIINGVIHAAGIKDSRHFELIEDISIEKAFTVFKPKVKGIKNVYEVFRSRNPDFVWITSSLAAVLGGLSFSSYSSANLFMDHFIFSKGEELLNWKSVNLGEMVFAEKDGDSQALNPDELASFFEWSVSIEGTVVESKEDLFERIRRVYETKKEVYLNNDFNVAENIMQLRPNLSTPYVDANTETERRLKVVFQNFFGISSIGVEDNFFELGGDSLKAMVLLKRIKKEFNIALTLKDFFSKTNIKLMAEKIDETLWLMEDIETSNEITI